MRNNIESSNFHIFRYWVFQLLPGFQIVDIAIAYLYILPHNLILKYLPLSKGPLSLLYPNAMLHPPLMIPLKV